MAPGVDSRLVLIESELQRCLKFIDDHPEVHSMLESRLLGFEKSAMEQSFRWREVDTKLTAICEKLNVKKSFWNFANVKDLISMITLLGGLLLGTVYFIQARTIEYRYMQEQAAKMEQLTNQSRGTRN